MTVGSSFRFIAKICVDFLGSRGKIVSGWRSPPERLLPPDWREGTHRVFHKRCCVMAVVWFQRIVESGLSFGALRLPCWFFPFGDNTGGLLSRIRAIQSWHIGMPSVSDCLPQGKRDRVCRSSASSCASRAHKRVLGVSREPFLLCKKDGAEAVSPCSISVLSCVVSPLQSRRTQGT